MSILQPTPGASSSSPSSIYPTNLPCAQYEAILCRRKGGSRRKTRLSPDSQTNGLDFPRRSGKGVHFSPYIFPLFLRGKRRNKLIDLVGIFIRTSLQIYLRGMKAHVPFQIPPCIPSHVSPSSVQYGERRHNSCGGPPTPRVASSSSSSSRRLSIRSGVKAFSYQFTMLRKIVIFSV